MTCTLGEFIYDSSVIIAQVFEESRYESRLKYLEKDVELLHIEHLATPSIIRETRLKVKFVGEYLASTVRELNRTVRRRKDPSNTNPTVIIGDDDIPFLKTYFANLSKNMGGNRSDQIQKEYQDYFETWIISTHHESFISGARRTAPLSDFMTKCAGHATDLHSALNQELQRRISKNTETTCEDETIQFVKSKLPFLTNESDLRILAEVMKYQKKQSKLVFVTLDYRDLASHAEEIQDAIGVRVADPLYALDVLKDSRVIKSVFIPSTPDFLKTV